MPAELADALKQETPDMQEELEQTWKLLSVAQPAERHTPTGEKAAMWARIQQQVAADISAAATDRSTRRPLRLVTSRRWLAIAATFALLAISGYLFYTMPVTKSALPGKMASVELPDGSVIELNSGSSISYRRGFGSMPFSAPEIRQIRLEGEGFFTVAESGTPFVVETYNAEVTVLGTTFNVRAWQQDLNKTAVTLASGRVEVAAKASPDRRTVLNNPGDRIEIIGSEPTPAAPQESDVDAAVIWRSAGFAVSGEPLRSVFAELERRFDVEITVRDQDILADSLNIMLSRPGTIETVLNDICTPKDLNFRRTSRGYEVY